MGLVKYEYIILSVSLNLKFFFFIDYFLGILSMGIL